ncbi:hypothetical protein RSAG8_11577, partial [Rhizoctonia solani AG-8 WAC10335]
MQIGEVEIVTHAFKILVGSEEKSLILRRAYNRDCILGAVNAYPQRLKLAPISWTRCHTTLGPPSYPHNSGNLST